MGKPILKPIPASDVTPLVAGVAFVVNFHAVIGTSPQQLTNLAAGGPIPNLGLTICQNWVALQPWSANTGNMYLGGTNGVTKPTAGTPNGTDGFTLVKGTANFFKAPRGFDLWVWLWVIASAVNQDLDVFGC
jgi:hypothetical protein